MNSTYYERIKTAAAGALDVVTVVTDSNAGAVTIVNGSGTWLPDGTDRSCQDTDSPVCNSTTNILCVSCTSSDWLAPSCPDDWNFQAACCATWTRQCAGNTPNLGFSAYGPVSALLAQHGNPDANSDDGATAIKTGTIKTDDGQT